MFIVSLDELTVLEEQDIRYDYGDLEELASSIEAEGVKQALFGVPIEKGTRFAIVDGHRRYHALQLLAERGVFPEIPIRRTPSGYNEMQKVADILIFNNQKELNMLEQAEVVHRLQNNFPDADGNKLSTRKIARMWGKSHTHISNLLKLAELSETSKEFIKDDIISPSLVLKTIVDNGMAAAEALIQKAVEQTEGTVTAKNLEEEQEEAEHAEDLEEGVEAEAPEVKEVKVKPSKLNELITFIEEAMHGMQASEQDKDKRKTYTQTKIMLENHIRLFKGVQSFLRGEIEPQDVYKDYEATFKNLIP